MQTCKQIWKNNLIRKTALNSIDLILVNFFLLLNEIQQTNDCADPRPKKSISNIIMEAVSLLCIFIKSFSNYFVNIYNNI